MNKLVAGQQEKLEAYNLIEAENLNLWKLDSLSFDQEKKVHITYYHDIRIFFLQLYNHRRCHKELYLRIFRKDIS